MTADSTTPTDDSTGQVVGLASHGRTILYDRTNHQSWIASDDAIDLTEMQ